jgi:hypothetical protein
MRKIIILIILLGLPCFAHAYIRDARLDSNSISVGYVRQTDPDEDNSYSATSISNFSFEKLISDDSSFGFMCGKADNVVDPWSWNQTFTLIEASYNKNIFRNDVFASSWIFGISVRNRIDYDDNLYPLPELGIALSYRPLNFLTLRSNLVLSDLFGIGIAINLPYNLEISEEYYWYTGSFDSNTQPICMLSYKI